MSAAAPVCPSIISLETAVPPSRMSQADTVAFAELHFGPKIANFERYLPVFANSGIESRHVSVPADWFSTPHSISEKNRLYIEISTQLCSEAADRAMQSANVRPDQIDYILYINTTGIATPSIDARLINQLGLRRNTRRTPIWGLGCAGGVAGISHAYHYLAGHPDDTVLLVCAELCSLTFLSDDYSKSNIIASALFADGAAAAVVRNSDAPDGLRILGTRSSFFPDSLDVMGWNVVDEGLQVVFAQRIPEIVASHVKDDLTEFLLSHGLRLEDVHNFLFHPGGTKVLAAYADALALHPDRFRYSQQVLRDFGNMSSVTVLFVIKQYLDSNRRSSGSLGLVSALGPGFCSESVIVRG